MGVSAAALSLLTLRSRRVFKTTPLLVTFFTALSVFSLVQLVPLPIQWIALLSPNKLAILNESRQLLGLSMPSFTAITLDTSATLLETIKTLSYALLSFSLFRIGHDNKGREYLTKLYLGLGGTVLLIALVHFALKLDSLYGFYQPEINVLGTLSPILNSNHLAAYLGSIACGALVYSLMNKGPLKIIGLIFTFCLVAMSLFQQSRSATISMSIGMVVSVIFLFKNRSPKKTSHSLFWGIALLSCFAVLGVAMFEQIYSQFNNGTTAELLGDKAGKFRLWRDSEALFWAHSLLGIGRGAFESAIGPFVSHDTIQRFSHVENAPLQALLDWGTLMGGLAIVLFLSTLKNCVATAFKSPLHGGAFAGLAVLVIQSIGDFSFHLPAIVFLFIIYMSILSSSTLKVTRKSFFHARIVRLAILGTLLISVTVASLPGLSPLRADQEKLDLLPKESDAALTFGKEALKRHPADFLITGYLAESHLNKSPKESLGFVNYSIRRNNNYSRTHQLAALLLLKTAHKKQACLEYKRSMELSPAGIEFLEPMLQSFSQHDLLNCLPTQGRLALQILDRLRIRMPRLAFDFATQLTELQPDNHDAWSRLATIAHDQKNNTIKAKALLAAYNISPSINNVVFLSKHYIQSKELRQAENLLEKHISISSLPNERAQLYLELASIEIEKADHSKARKYLEQAMNSSFQSLALKRAVYLKKASLERSLGNENRAEWEEKQAELLLPKQRP